MATNASGAIQWPNLQHKFLSDPGIPGPIYGSGLSHSLTVRRFADLTDMTLVDEDTKSIQTGNVNRAIRGNQAMHVTNSLVCKMVCNAIGAIQWSNL